MYSTCIFHIQITVPIPIFWPILDNPDLIVLHTIKAIIYKYWGTYSSTNIDIVSYLQS